jgi:SWI/SNF-related matrix-associated actin-dependent regulator of chromatin subfamily D
LVNRYLGTPDPVVLHYVVNPATPPPERPSAWDVEVKMEDTSIKSRMSVMINANKESALALDKMDEEVIFFPPNSDLSVIDHSHLKISRLAQSLSNSHLKRAFLQSFADDPAQFIQTWIESQSRDLETILGSGPSEGMTVRQEELRRSEFFQLPWVEEVPIVICYRDSSLLIRYLAGRCYPRRYTTIYQGYAIVAIVNIHIVFEVNR